MRLSSQRVILPGACALATLLLFAMTAEPIAAATSRWEFEGLVRDYTMGGGAPLPFPAAYTALGIESGTPFSGFLVVEDGLVGSRLNANTHLYAGALVGGSFEIGQLTLTVDAPGLLTVALDRQLAGSPPEGTSLYRLGIGGPGQGALGVSDPDLLALAELSIYLLDGGQDVITDLSFPTLPPDLADLDPYAPRSFSTNLGLGFTSGGGLVFAEITGLTVPEPSTALLLGLGLLGIAAARQRNPV